MPSSPGSELTAQEPHHAYEQSEQRTVVGRELARTPSPTPSEQRVLEDDGKVDLRRFLRRVFQKQNWKYLILLAFFAGVGILMVVYHETIIDHLKPAANWMHRTKAGFLIPIAVMIILSIPPLFGQEVVIILVGFTWSLGVAFAIAAAGTLAGELFTYILFRFFLRRRALAYEQKQVRYALLAHVIREGGLKAVIIARYSVIPGHLLTALFSTCGIGVFVFLIAAIASLPKQLVAVYLGYALRQDNGHNTKGSTAVKYVALAVYVVLSLVAMRYLRAKQLAVREPVVYERRKRRQAGKPDPAPSELEEGAGQAPLYAPKAQRAGPEASFAPAAMPTAYPPPGMPQAQHATAPKTAMPEPMVPMPAHTGPDDSLRRSGDGPMNHANDPAHPSSLIPGRQ